MIKKTVYFGNPAYLSLAHSQLVVRRPATSDNDPAPPDVTLPVEDIACVVLDNRQVTITSAAIDALLQGGCALITCNAKSMPAGLMLPLEGNTLQSERFRSQTQASLPLKKQLWQQTVRQKILNQADTLSRHHTAAEIRGMQKWAADVRSGDPANLEARAAAYYWRHIFHHLIPQFVRDPDGDAPNHLLNYGYAILRAVMARALTASGLLPTFGLHHRNRYNAYCLADDIMEPYRPFVDDLVLDIIADNTADTALTRQVKARLLTIPTLTVRIDGRRSPLMVAASLTTASLAKCLGGEERRISYPTF